MGMLITMRAVQGLGAGGLTALAQVIMATMIAPRQRGRYSGYLGATFALATVGGPLIGGVLTQHLSWHWCFYVGIPFAVLALAVLQKTLHLPVTKRKVQIDYLGATLLATGVAALLIWVSLAGNNFDWVSWESALMVGGGVLLLVLAVLAERQAPEPIIPLRLFRNRTVVFSSLASLFVGVALFGGTIFLSQYFQLARGETPTRSGLLTLPMIIGLFLSSTISGQIISRTGRWKAWVIVGGVLLTGGLGLMSTIAFDTDYWIVAPFMFLIGAGVGMMMQNLVLAVQNVIAMQDLGAASSFVAFARSLGGAIGVSALGAVLSTRVTHHLEDGLAAAGINATALPGSSTGIPDLSALPAAIRTVVQSAYGSAIADVFLAAAPFALISLIIAFFLKEIVLRSQQLPATEAEATPALSADDPAGEGAGDPVMVDAQRWSLPRDDRNQDNPGHDNPGQDRVGQDQVGQDHRPHHADGEEASETTSVARRAAEDPDALRIFGMVRQNGRTVAGAQVTLADQSGRQVARTATAEDGSYRLPLDNGGTYLLIVAAEGLNPTASLVPVGDAPMQRDVALAGRSAITGRVLRSDPGQGEPVGVSGALITLVDVTGEVVGSTHSEADGGYSFERLTGGSYVITAQSLDLRPVARSVDVAEAGAMACDLNLTGGGRLTGQVIADRDGSPVPDATITLVDGDGEVVATTTTSTDGDYLIDNLGSGHYTLTAAGYAPVAVGVDVEEEAVSALQVRLGSSATTQEEFVGAGQR